MDSKAVAAFLQANHRAILVTRRANGLLQSSPMAVLPGDEGYAVMSTRATTAKVKNASRDRRVSLCVIAEKWPGPWMHLDGTAEIVRLPDAMPLLADFYQRRTGEDTTTDTFRQRMEQEKRVLFRVKIDNVFLPNRG
jgi:PPOX class probable F420-dependent enzyme